MGGKASLLMVLGFSIIFLVAAYNFGGIATRAVDNNANYYEESVAHVIAISGANMAANEMFLDSDWDDGFDDLDFSHGTMDVAVTESGDTKVITSTGYFSNKSHQVKIKLNPSSFAKFAWYAGNMSSKVFITGDSVYGPFHTQSKMNIGGDPVFFGKVTNKKGFSPSIAQWAANGYDPKFYAGFQTGVDIPLPVNYQFTEQKALALDGVNNHGGSSYFENTDLWLTLNDDATITYRTGTGPDSSTYSAPVTMPLADFAPTKMVYLKKGDIYISGTLTGQLSIVSGESSGLGNGNVYLVDDLVYKNDPVTYIGNNKYDPTTSTDMLGLMATNNIWIADTPQNENDVRLDASVFCAQGGFKVQNLSSINDRGQIFIRGGVVAAMEEEVAKIVTPGVIKGYKKHVIFDERNRLGTGPPLFPKTGMFEIVSWFE